MSITNEAKQKVIADYAISKQDTGSAAVQCAVLTERIKNLTEHIKSNHKDHHSRRGLLIMVGRRKRLLSYLKRKDEKSYLGLIKRLGLRK